MKSQFDGIVKVKKQELDKVEMLLLKARNRVKELEKLVQDAYDEILKAPMPTSGTIAQLSQSKELLSRARAKKELLDEQVSLAWQEIEKTQDMYNHALKEIEKMSYLQGQEIAKKLRERQKQEQKDLDEISVQLFARENG